MAKINPTADPDNDASVSLRSVWNYLSQEEENETNWSLKDDLRITKLCLIEVEKGNPDPWRYAFWKYMGIPYEKWQGIYAEREAYERLLGPTLAEELENPLFLASLEPLVRASLFKAAEQMRLDFNAPPSPEPKAA